MTTARLPGPTIILRCSMPALNAAAVIESFPCAGIESTTKLQFKRLVGEAIACALDHDYDGAKTALASAEAFIRARSEETSRFWYLSASFSAAAAFVLLGFIIWACRTKTTLLLSESGSVIRHSDRGRRVRFANAPYAHNLSHPHPEERPQGASRRMKARDIAAFFAGSHGSRRIAFADAPATLLTMRGN